jgi:hypothetical protein
MPMTPSRLPVHVTACALTDSSKSSQERVLSYARATQSTEQRMVQAMVLPHGLRMSPATRTDYRCAHAASASCTDAHAPIHQATHELH